MEIAADTHMAQPPAPLTQKIAWADPNVSNNSKQFPLMYVACTIARMYLAYLLMTKQISKTTAKWILRGVAAVFTLKWSSTGGGTWKNYHRTVIAYTTASMLPMEAAGAVVAADTLCSITQRHIAELVYQS